MLIYILLTENCNLNCSMCIRGRNNGSSLSLESLKQMTWVNELANHDLILTGGEPTLVNGLDNIAFYLSQKAKSLIINTNGTNRNFITDTMLKIRKLHIQISIDGDINAHDKIRGKGVYSKVISTMKLLNDLNLSFSVSSVVNSYNKDSMFTLEKELQQFQNLKYWKVSYQMPFGSATLNEMLSAEEWNCFVDKLIQKAKIKLKIQKIFAFDIYEKYKDKLFDMYLGKERVNNCGSGKTKIYIYPDLNVYSCTCLKNFPLGNLHNNSLSEILNGSEIQKFTCYSVRNEICINCKYLKYCNGGCIGMSYHFFNKLGWGDLRCPLLKKQQSMITKKQ